MVIDLHANLNVLLKYVDIYNICVLPLQYKIQEGGIYEILFNV